MTEPRLTERITLLATPQFKQHLNEQARAQGVSVGEFVRRRCQSGAGADPELAVLATLTEQLRASTARARKSLRESRVEVDAVLGALRAQREKAPRHSPRAHKSALGKAA